MAKIKLPPDYKEVHFKKNSEAVVYKGEKSTLKLNKVSGLKVSEYGGELLKISDGESLIEKLNIDSEVFFDETESVHWAKVGNPTVANGTLSTSSGNYIRSTDAISFGGADFTISMWYTDSGNGTLLTTSDGAINITRNGGNLTWVIGNNTLTIPQSSSLSHLEINYSQSAGRLYIYRNGTYVGVPYVSLSRAERNVSLGDMSCTFREFRILNGVCLHTQAFTPPNEFYTVNEYTASLLHFD